MMQERVAQETNPFLKALVAFYAWVHKMHRKFGLPRLVRAPSIHRQRLFAIILLICQTGITFTGSLVRYWLWPRLRYVATMPPWFPVSRSGRSTVDSSGHRIRQPHVDLRPCDRCLGDFYQRGTRGSPKQHFAPCLLPRHRHHHPSSPRRNLRSDGSDVVDGSNALPAIHAAGSTRRPPSGTHQRTR